MPDDNDGELASGADIAAARAEFLHAPPEIIDVNAPEAPVVDDEAALENAAIDELSQPPADGGEGAAAPAPAPAPAGTPDYSQYGYHDDQGNWHPGTEESVYTAWQIQQAMRTVQGIRTLVANGLHALGYDAGQIKEALDAYDPEAGGGAAPEGGTAPAADLFAGLEDDDTVSVAAVKQFVSQAAAQAVAQATAATQQSVQPIEEALAEQRQTHIRGLVDGALQESLGPVPGDDPAKLAAYIDNAKRIENRAGAYFDPAQWNNPTHIRQAVQHAAADLEAENKAALKAYIATKKSQRDSQPPNTGGGAGSDGPLAEPKSLKEAREQARATGFFG